MSVSMADLPKWTGVHVVEDPVPPGPLSRRTLLRRLAGVGVFAFGLSVLDLLGGTAPANAARTCSVEDLTYRKNCAGANYATTCSNGCARTSAVNNPSFCRYDKFNSRHRTCGETQTIKGKWWDYAIRTNQCYDGVSDGWRWSGVDTGGKCNCKNQRQFSCNDGYYKNDPDAAYAPSICQKRRCR